MMININYLNKLKKVTFMLKLKLRSFNSVLDYISNSIYDTHITNKIK